jgi:ABC-type amino acid transport substrate-binding protein
MAALSLAAALLVSAAQVAGAGGGVAAAGACAAEAAQSGKLTVGVTDSGFTPSEATADPGLVHLTLENRGGAERVKVRFARQGGAVISELEVGGNGGSLATELEVAAGTVYTLTEEEHGWVFRLTVSGTAPAPPAQAPPEGE